MPYNDIITPRQEVLRKEGIDGVIDIENLRDKKLKTVESRPEDFLEITYPTSDIKLVINNLNQRFNLPGKSSGLFLLEGLKGSGKSHLELLIYHLLKNPSAANKWLERNNIEFKIPQDTIIVIHKFTDFPLDSIWSLVFQSLGIKNVSHDRVPNLDEFREALGNRKLVLILDELEMGIKSIVNENIRARNIAFLQMLSEESLRTETASVTIIASIYNSDVEPGATLKRVSPVDIKFLEADDRLKVVQHRLFLDYEKLSRKRVEVVVNSYLNSWKKQGIEINEKQIDEMYATFPFSPEFIQMVLFNVQSRGGFQGTRGALGLLATVMRNVYKKADIITSSSLNIKETSISVRLSDLDPSRKIIDSAKNDLQNLHTQPFISEIVGAVLMSSLAPSGKIQGISENQLAREVLKPGDDINSFYATLQALEKYGTYFQSQEGNYYFDIEEKPNAKVEYRSLGIDTIKARDYSLKQLTDLFKDPRVIVYKDLAQVKSELFSREKNSLRIILSPKRLSRDERIAVYHGAENRNQIILLEPRDPKFNGLDNSDILKWAQRAIAAEELEATASDDRVKQYLKIKNEDNSYIKESFKRAGLIYIWFQASGENEKLVTEEESLRSANSREEVIRILQEEIFPRQTFEEHLQNRLENILNKSVRDVESEYKRTLGFPVHTALTTFFSAVKNLCRDGKIGLRHERDSACGRIPILNETELLDAKIVEPFEDVRSKDNVFESTPSKEKLTTNDNKEEIDTRSSELIHSSANVQLQSVVTPFCNSIGVLRQELASKLNEQPDSLTKTIQFFVYSEQKEVELSNFPASLRGNLSGNSDITIDLSIKKTGDFTKAQVEQMIEMLPVINNAQYKAELKIKVNEKAEVHE